ncbi:uncharacterized protein LOC134194022 [Corticium candelabrum]|uniref:uncharacterized protein LOC134194022 n=1 Tax=Corticium candelabrum TaxID=121492 RepID=UPI002E267A3C|nr:uncharacterized protein LOC134194022 [Corticium candelabrum]
MTESVTTDHQTLSTPVVPVPKVSNSEASIQEKAEKYGLKIEQAKAFKEVFDLFDEYGGGTIEAEQLDATMKSVDITLTQEDIKSILQVIDTGNGEIDFDDFLRLMMSTDKYVATKLELKENQQTSNARQSIFLSALTRFLKASAMSSLAELQRFYNIQERKAPHVVRDYADGQRVIGLTAKQLEKRLAALRASNKENQDSPYAQPVFHLNQKDRQPTRKWIQKKFHKSGKHTIKLIVLLKFGAFKTTPNTQQTNPPTNDTHKQQHSNATEKQKRSGALSTSRRRRHKSWARKVNFTSGVTLPRLDKSMKLSELGNLTVDKLPTIRKKVSAAIVDYYKQLNQMRDMLSKKHWKDLCIESVPSPYLRKIFKEVFEAYTEGQKISLPWISP